MIILTALILAFFVTRLILVILNYKFSPRIPFATRLKQYPLISLLLVADSDSRRCLHVLDLIAHITYPNLEVIVALNMESGGMKSFLSCESHFDKRTRILKIAEIPKGWSLSCYFRQKLGEVSRGSYMHNITFILFHWLLVFSFN